MSDPDSNDQLPPLDPPLSPSAYPAQNRYVGHHLPPPPAPPPSSYPPPPSYPAPPQYPASPYAASPYSSTPNEPPQKRRPWALFVGVIALLAVAAGVIVFATRGDERELTLAEAAAKTEDQHTARVEFTADFPFAGNTGAKVLAKGEIDFDKNVVKYTMDVADMLNGAGVDVPRGQGKIRAIASGLTIYMSMPVFDEEPSLRGKWLKLDVGEALASLGLDIEKVADYETGGPGTALARLQSISDEVENLGREDVRGVDTTRYRASFDLEKVYRSLGAVIDEDAFQLLLDAYSTTMVTTEAWVDDDGLVRRTVTELPLATGTQQIKVEFFDFGVNIDSSVPADADTFDVSDLEALEGK